MCIENLNEDQLIQRLYEMKDNWSNDKGLMNSHPEEINYVQIKKRLKSVFQVDAEIYELPIEQQTDRNFLVVRIR